MPGYFGFVPAFLPAAPMETFISYPPGVFKSKTEEAPPTKPGHSNTAQTKQKFKENVEPTDVHNSADDKEDSDNIVTDVDCRVTQDTFTNKRQREAVKKGKRKKAGRKEIQGKWELSSELEERLMRFIESNELDAEAGKDLEASPPEVIEHVLAKGEVLSARNPSALLSVRIMQAWRDLKKEGIKPNKSSIACATEPKPKQHADSTTASEQGQAEKAESGASEPEQGQAQK
jgi:hypothetical protein